MTRPHVLVLVFVACFAGVVCSQEPPKPPDYYPLAVGNTWRYRVEVPGGTQEHTLVVTNVDVVDGQPRAHVENSIAGKRSGNDYLAAADKGIFRYGAPPFGLKSPICLLRYPVKIGDSWTDTVQVGGETVKASHRVEKLDEVEVPAGKYQAVKVIGTTEIGSQKVETTFWFADGVGVVKQLVTLPKATVKLELQKFEKGR